MSLPNATILRPQHKNSSAIFVIFQLTILCFIFIYNTSAQAAPAPAPMPAPAPAPAPVHAAADNENRLKKVIAIQQVKLAGMKNELDDAKKHLVPTGTIIWWYRATATQAIPDGFKICDGTTINSPGSTLHQTNSPNLINKFVRGSTSGTGESGGSDTFGTNDQISGTTDSNGAHRHKIPFYVPAGGGRSAFMINSWDNNGETGQDPTFGESWTFQPGSGYIPHLPQPTAGTLSVSGMSGAHRHGFNSNLNGIDKKPAYVGLLPLIKM
ncbi:MAG: hypothetical protein HQK53_15940 [Oligoflexia bacterium]|nr:hypothetical protein [Oligoflexia bacterium]